MTIVEDKKEVKVYNVYGMCSDCDVMLTENIPFIVWDNNGSIRDLSDDSFEYSYICPNCNKVINSIKKYPHQEFVEV